MRPNIHNLHRNGNTIVMSEDLDDNAVQILVDVAFSKIFSDQCSKWHATKKGIREQFREELVRRQEVVCQDLYREEHALQGSLREAVVSDVVKLFPWVFFMPSKYGGLTPLFLSI
jgi:hypothetical protein